MIRVEQSNYNEPIPVKSIDTKRLDIFGSLDDEERGEQSTSITTQKKLINQDEYFEVQEGEKNKLRKQNQDDLLGVLDTERNQDIEQGKRPRIKTKIPGNTPFNIS